MTAAGVARQPDEVPISSVQACILVECQHDSEKSMLWCHLHHSPPSAILCTMCWVQSMGTGVLRQQGPP